ncbi:MAG: ABC transporter substrate-binding protein [Candidatus Bathyarchaeota archaeon]|nr:ABC transporter substrate-binding protein [Candidatus Bathyarchaeota archaeon]
MSTKGITTVVAVILMIIMLLAGLGIGYLLAPSIGMAPGAGLSDEVEIGALMSLTGDLASFGENEMAAAEFAATEVNALLEDLNAGWTLKLVAEDTQTDPDIALEKLESLAARGIKLIIGPLSSGEVRAIKGFADQNKILVTSQSSTAPDLAIAGDYIFRFCPTDKLGQGPAIARLIYDEGYTHVIPVTRNDAWGIGLKDATKAKFEALGGTFLTGIDYDPEASEFTSEASILAGLVQDAISAHGAGNVAILHISFEEAVPFMTACLDHSVLSQVKWYGSDGTAASGGVLEDTNVRDFILDVEYPCTIFSPAPVGDKFEAVRANGFNVLGREPESYSYAIYDIVWVYALSLLAVNEYNAEAIKEVLPTITEVIFGASGVIRLDEAGDRTAGDYNIWKIQEVSVGNYAWEVVGRYIFATDTIEWSE